MKKRFLTLSLVVFVLFGAGCATSRVHDYATATTRPIVVPMNDSLEGYNRTIDVVDEQLKRRVMTPIACVWKFLLPQVVRDSVEHFVTNLGYPLNLLSHLLGGQFGYAWRDTQRFGINTTVGVLGLMDPATTKYGLFEIKGGFGRTFSKWGIGQGPYLELPILGGASTRDHVGTLFDGVLNPLGYFLPQEVTLAITGVKGVNYYSIMEPTLSQLYLTSEYHYEKMRLFMHYSETLYDEEYKFDENSPEWDADDSLGYMAFAPQSPMVLHCGRTRTLKISGIGKVNYSRWLVKNSQKLVIILPGLGSHRQDNSVLAFAERLNREGVSVAALSSTFTPDFFKHLDGDRPSGYLPEDAKVLAQILPAIKADVVRSGWVAKEQRVALLGYSIGALNTLFLAATEQDGRLAPNLEIDHYVAINPPASALDSTALLDTFFDIPEKKWGEEREARVRDVILRIGAFIAHNYNNPTATKMPLTRDESLFLIGMNMRMNLATCQMAQQKRHNTGIFKEDPNAFANRNALFAEAMNYGFSDYIAKVVLPWYRAHGFENATQESMTRECTIPAIADKLRNNSRITIIHNENDPIITKEQADWFKRELGATIFPRGGHLGNMAVPDYLKNAVKKLME